MTEEMPHLLVVDDDTRLRDLLQKYLTEQGFRVTTARDAAQGRAHLASLAFDLIVMDVMMPGEDGFSLTRSLRENSNVPILMLTAMGDADDRINGLEHGADDYLVKPFEPRELVLRVRTILRRAAMAPSDDPPSTVVLGDCVFDLAREELRRRGEAVRLTDGERALLKALALRPGEPVGREALGEQGDGAAGSRMVDVQVTRLRRKIEPDPRQPRYLQTVRGKGYVLRPD